MVGFGAEENDAEGGVQKPKGDDSKDEESSGSTYGEVSQLSYLPASQKMAGAISILDISAFIKDLPLFPYHKILA